MKGGKLQIGIIGCGGIANGKHMPALAKLSELCTMAAFCDIVEERAVKAKSEYGTPDSKVYTDYKKLLEDDSIDVVHVLTPNVLHCPITVDAFAAGKHVMSEKPMASTSADAQKDAYRRGKKAANSSPSAIKTVSVPKSKHFTQHVKTVSWGISIMPRRMPCAAARFPPGGYSPTKRCRAAGRSLISARMRWT